MTLDVTAEQRIEATPERVSAYAVDPTNDPVWIGGISAAEMLDPPPLREGSTVRRVASFMGRRIEYVLEVAELDPSARLAMRSIKSPFPMAVTYTFQPSGSGTMMRIRVQGEPGGLYRLAGPFLPGAVRWSVAGDLRRLKGILER